MFTGQLDWTSPSDRLDAAGQWTGRNSAADGEVDAQDFALLFDTMLALSDDHGAGLMQAGTAQREIDDFGELISAEPFPDRRSNFSLGGSIGHPMPSIGQIQGPALPVDRSSAPQPAAAPPVGISAANSSLAETSRQPADSGRRIPPVASAQGSLNKSQLSEWMDAHALSRSSHHCAMYCRLGMEAAGMSTADRPQSGDAADYGPFLLRHGAQTISPESYVPAVGDVVVFDKTEQHPCGHIEMYDGHQWVSDFRQHSFSPYRDASSTPSFTIYRLG